MSTVSRFSGLPQDDNTDRVIKNDFQQPAYAATITLLIKGLIARTIIKPAVLTGAVTFNVNVVDPLSGDALNGPFVGDVIEFYLVADGTSRVVTFGTGFLPTATLSVTTAKYAYAAFKFNGTGWIEIGSAVSA
jgi:hypothetical protein